METDKTARRRITAGSRRRIGIVAAAADLGVGYPHLYKCIRWLNGDRSDHARKPGRALAERIRQRYPELLLTEKAAPAQAEAAP